MCGRYDNLIAREAYRRLFKVERLPASNFPPCYNVAPTDQIPVVRVDPRAPPSVPASTCEIRYVRLKAPAAVNRRDCEMTRWTAKHIPNQAGRTALVTGANSGLGYFVSLELARQGAHVIMTARDARKGNAALARLKSELPNAKVELRLLDLNDLDDVARFAAKLVSERTPLDLLINNAGLMMPPRGTTKQGFETQIGVNHLAHFALTLRLLGLMQGRPDARVVTVSSGLHKSGKIDLDDLHSEKAYSPTAAYAQSKIANVYFGLELDRRLRAMGSPIKSILAHPGIAKTNLMSSMSPNAFKLVMNVFMSVMAQGPADGALPILHAATAPGVQGGQFFGPRGLELRGSPVLVRPAELATDPTIAKQLWDKSIELTGVRLETASAKAL
jgi:NAD(P)-dependent dehydrogenase (short-subunit alcohol dehydrogenase family)